jgi:predicted dehydrogenase
MEPILVRPEDLQLPSVMPLPKRRNWSIGMVGFGDFARRAHAPDYQQAGWKLAAVAVGSKESQEIARTQFGVERVYSDYRELVEDETVEVVDLVTQPSLREEVVMAAAAAGKHIIVEKPFGTSTDECLRMIEAADKAGVLVAVHQNYRWMRGNFLAHHIVRAGMIGSPFFLSIEKFGQQDETRRDSSYANCDNYLTLHWNTHFVDLFRYWSGRDAHRVSTHARRMTGQNFRSDNLLQSLHDFGDGLTGHILHSELLRSSLGGDNCRIDGDEGSLVFDFEGERILLDSRKLGHKIHKIDTSGMVWMEPLCGSMGDFLLAIEEDRPPSVSGRNNLATMNTVLAEMDSAKSGGNWVSVSR